MTDPLSTPLQLSPTHFKTRHLENMVENRTIYSLPNAELNIYETHRVESAVQLRFQDPVLASMVTGKKVMHLGEAQAFDFYPGESVILPANELMRIDFPEATELQPTQCLALVMAPDKINSVVDFLNDQHPKSEAGSEWQFTDYNFHFMNDLAVNQIIQRLIFLFTENHPSKSLFADFMLRELIIRLMQTEARHLLTEQPDAPNSSENRLAYIVQYIREHLQDNLNITNLSRQAYMSQSHFFRCFRNELGLSPIDFINKERIKCAKKMLEQTKYSIAEIAAACGFNNLPYFLKQFKRYTRLTPSQYRNEVTPGMR